MYSIRIYRMRCGRRRSGILSGSTKLEETNTLQIDISREGAEAGAGTDVLTFDNSALNYFGTHKRRSVARAILCTFPREHSDQQNMFVCE